MRCILFGKNVYLPITVVSGVICEMYVGNLVNVSITLILILVYVFALSDRLLLTSSADGYYSAVNGGLVALDYKLFYFSLTGICFFLPCIAFSIIFKIIKAIILGLWCSQHSQQL